MRSPYLIFVAAIARLVGGEYPAHFDSSVRRRIRIVLGLGTAIVFVLSMVTTVKEGNVQALLDGQVTFNKLSVALGVIGGLATAHAARLRRRSIEKHVLKTSYLQVAGEDSTDTVEDTNLLFDYMKVFFVLALLLTIPDIVGAFIMDPEPLLRVRMTLLFAQMYYVFLFMDLAIVVGGRWGRKHISNDRSSTQDPTKS